MHVAYLLAQKDTRPGECCYRYNGPQAAEERQRERKNCWEPNRIAIMFCVQWRMDLGRKSMCKYPYTICLPISSSDGWRIRKTTKMIRDVEQKDENAMSWNKQNAITTTTTTWTMPMQYETTIKAVLRPFDSIPSHRVCPTHIATVTAQSIAIDVHCAMCSEHGQRSPKTHTKTETTKKIHFLSCATNTNGTHHHPPSTSYKVSLLWKRLFSYFPLFFSDG